MGDLRWYCIREIGNIKETARASGKNVYHMKMELDILKGRVGIKSEAHLVQDEFTRLREDTRTEMVNLMADVDSAGMEAKLATINDLVATFGSQVQEAFRHVAAVEASFQTHVAQGFADAVTALQ